MMWGRQPEADDWVRASRQIKTNLTDHLTGSGIEPGARGVVTGRSGKHVDVEFDTGYGTTSVTVPASHVKLTHRGGGTNRFRRRIRVMTTIRLALLGFLLYPMAEFAIQYLLQYGTLDGIVPAFTLAAVEGIGEWLMTAIYNPIQTLIYSAFLAVLGRIAFRK
jgi:hypothetical protein